MFLGYQNGKVKFYTEKALNPVMYNLERVEETEDEYALEGEEYVLVDEAYKAEKLAEAKEAKIAEALEKANLYQQNGVVEHKNCVFEMSDSNRKNLSDTEEALKLQGIEETTWLDKDDNYVTLTVDDIQYIRLNLILAAIQKLWIVDYPLYKELIEAAETIEEVEAIEIVYPIDEEEPEEVEELEEEEPEEVEEE